MMWIPLHPVCQCGRTMCAHMAFQSVTSGKMDQWLVFDVLQEWKLTSEGTSSGRCCTGEDGHQSDGRGDGSGARGVERTGRSVGNRSWRNLPSPDSAGQSPATYRMINKQRRSPQDVLGTPFRVCGGGGGEKT
jgi:hypothetical protein